jgi:hypothetical protein
MAALIIAGWKAYRHITYDLRGEATKSPHNAQKSHDKQVTILQLHPPPPTPHRFNEIWFFWFIQHSYHDWYERDLMTVIPLSFSISTYKQWNVTAELLRFSYMFRSRFGPSSRDCIKTYKTKGNAHTKTNIKNSTIWLLVQTHNAGRDSSVAIQTRYWLDGPEIESRWRRDFLHQSKLAPGAHPASHKMDTGSLSRGANRPGCGLDHPPTSRAEVEERVQLYLYSPSEPSWPVLGQTLPFALEIQPTNTPFTECMWAQNTFEGEWYPVSHTVISEGILVSVYETTSQ